jgi:hypothetical protein
LGNLSGKAYFGAEIAMTHATSNFMKFPYTFLPLLALLLYTAAPCTLSAQRSRVLSGMVIDASTQKPMFRATVRSEKHSRKTDNKGAFSFEIIQGEPLLVSSVGYHTRKINFENYRNRDSLKIYITPASSLLSNVVQAKVSEVVYQKHFENVLDYVFLGDTMAVLAYMEYKPRTLQANEAYFHNTITFTKYGTAMERIVLPDHVLGLFLDPFNRLWVVGDQFALQVVRSPEGYELLEIDRDFFDKRIAPAAAASRSSVFFTEVLPVIPQINLYILSAGADSSQAVRLIRNERYFLEAPGDYRMLSPELLQKAHALAQEHNIDAMYFAPALRWFSRHELVELNKINYDELSVYDQPEAQIFALGDRIIVFDILNSWIFHHDMAGNPLDSVPMYHHNFESEKYRGMVQDQYTGKCYAIHTKGAATYLREVSPFHGGAGRPFKLRKRFPETIRVFNGWVYYSHRTPDTKEFYKLMREKLIG